MEAKDLIAEVEGQRRLFKHADVVLLLQRLRSLIVNVVDNDHYRCVRWELFPIDKLNSIGRIIFLYNSMTFYAIELQWSVH